MSDQLMTHLIIWAIVFAICIIIEIATLGLTTIWFAGGAVIAALSAFLSISFLVQVLIFAIVSLILLFTTRPIAKKHFNGKMEKTNVESIIGQKVVVTQTINNLTSEGQVKVNGLEWTARAQNNDIIPEGTLVQVDHVSGVKVFVSKCN